MVNRPAGEQLEPGGLQQVAIHLHAHSGAAGEHGLAAEGHCACCWLRMRIVEGWKVQLADLQNFWDLGAGDVLRF